MNAAQQMGRLMGLALLAIGLTGCGSRMGRDHPPVLAGEPRLRVAQAAEEAGDLSMAEELYAAASAAEPREAVVQLRYADLLVRRGRLSEARELLERSVGVVADSVQLRGGMGALYVLTGEPERAVAEFDMVLAARPGDARATVNKAIALDLLRRHDEAQALYRAALAVAPRDSVVINNLALSLMLAGRAQEGGALLEQIKDRADLPPRIRGGMAVVLAASGNVAGGRVAAGDQLGDAQLAELADAARRSRLR